MQPKGCLLARCAPRACRTRRRRRRNTVHCARARAHPEAASGHSPLHAQKQRACKDDLGVHSSLLIERNATGRSPVSSVNCETKRSRQSQQRTKALRASAVNRTNQLFLKQAHSAQLISTYNLNGGFVLRAQFAAAILQTTSFGRAPPDYVLHRKACRMELLGQLARARAGWHVAYSHRCELRCGQRGWRSERGSCGCAGGHHSSMGAVGLAVAQNSPT